MDPLSEDLFTQTSDGLILCKLINLAEFDTIDARSASTSIVVTLSGVNSPYIHPKERSCTSARIDLIQETFMSVFLRRYFMRSFFPCWVLCGFPWVGPGFRGSRARGEQCGVCCVTVARGHPFHLAFVRHAKVCGGGGTTLHSPGAQTNAYGFFTRTASVWSNQLTWQAVRRLRRHRQKHYLCRVLFFRGCRVYSFASFAWEASLACIRFQCEGQ